MKTKEIEIMPINQELLALITPQGIELKHNKVQLGEYQHKLQLVFEIESITFIFLDISVVLFLFL